MTSKRIWFRASSVGRIMTNPRSKSEGLLSKGAKSYIMERATERVFGVRREVDTKQMAKGLACEAEAIEVLNRVRGFHLTKNTERRDLDGLTGECDLYDPARNAGHDIKCAWSALTFPLFPEQAENSIYEWQARAYMALWDADTWEINHVLVDTPEELIGRESPFLHLVDHVPERKRITTVIYQRDADLERQLFERIAAGREYFAQIIDRFNESHKEAA